MVVVVLDSWRGHVAIPKVLRYILFLYEALEFALLGVLRATKVARQAGLPVGVSFHVIHALDEGNLFWEPGIQVGGANNGDVDAEGAVYPAALKADKDAEVS